MFSIAGFDAWNGLDEKTRGIVSKAAADAEAAGWAKAQELADWYKEQLAANGMTIEGPSDQLRTDFIKIGDQMTQEWLDRAGDNGKSVIEAYKKM